LCDTPWCGDILCGVGLVVHEEKVDFASVVDEEDLVAGWGHVLSLPVAAITDLQCCWLAMKLFAMRDLSFFCGCPCMSYVAVACARAG
jgi:hypothetical protein